MRVMCGRISLVPRKWGQLFESFSEDFTARQRFHKKYHYFTVQNKGNVGTNAVTPLPKRSYVVNAGLPNSPNMLCSE